MVYFYYQYTETKWRIIMSVNYATTGSDNVLSSFRYQAIIYTIDVI